MGLRESLFDRTTLGRLGNLLMLKLKANKLDGSFAGEFEYLKCLTKRMNIDKGFVVDVAASDGYTQSSTLGFFREGWDGLAVEMDPIKFASLSFLYADFPRVRLARHRVTPFNIKSLLESFEVAKDITVLNLDIDSYDLYVIEKMLAGGFKPKILSMEINEKIPAGVFFTVDYDDAHYWQGDHFYGCSIDAAATVVKPFGYILVGLEYNNAFFARKDVAAEGFIDLSPEDAYNQGYKNKADRKSLFPWNKNVEEWLNCAPNEAIEMIKVFFEKYNGKFTLWASSDKWASPDKPNLGA